VDQRRGLYAARQYSLNLKIGAIADLSLSNLAEGVRQPLSVTSRLDRQRRQLPPHIERTKFVQATGHQNQFCTGDIRADGRN
jgi:hypothetical protein